ncbi:MAG: hypothetical protein FWG02_00685 [Holophagaceae bacterium]|nr:hypothetical protein [Holophagaceae bacterium]
MTNDLSNDWRLCNQMEYLKGETIKHSKWITLEESWDHDHCAFCSDKLDASTIEKAYCTTDYYHWICPECYNDFKEMFEWTLEEL